MHPQHPEEMDVLMLHCKHLAFWIFSRIGFIMTPYTYMVNTSSSILL